MENTPTGHADDLPTILEIFKNDPKWRSVLLFVLGFPLVLPYIGTWFCSGFWYQTDD